MTDRDDLRWRLEDEAAFLERSLEDAHDELDAGELSVAEHAAIVDRDQGRLEVVRAELEALGVDRAPEQEQRAGVRRARSARQRAVLGVGGLVLVVAALVVVLAGYLHLRLPGQLGSGSPTLNAANQQQRLLAQADLEVEAGSLEAALALYDQVLAKNPEQPEALAEAGWITYLTGVAGHNQAVAVAGTNLVRRSVDLDPSAAAGHLFLGAIDLNLYGNAHAATRQFQAFLLDGPTVSQVVQAKPFILRAFRATGTELPPGL